MLFSISMQVVLKGICTKGVAYAKRTFRKKIDMRSFPYQTTSAEKLENNFATNKTTKFVLTSSVFQLLRPIGENSLCCNNKTA